VPTYRDDLEQAHQRIEQLEEELEEERAKHAPQPAPVPDPVVRVAPVPVPTSDPIALPATHSLEWYLWWPIPVAIAATVCVFIHFQEPFYVWVARSACAGSALMSLEAFLRWRNGGERNTICRLLFVASCVVGAPALFVAASVGAPVIGIVFSIIAGVAGLVALVRWIARG
jgi:hypothetical protein